MPGRATVTFRATQAFAEARSLKGLSQIELGQLAGFGQASVSRLERGQHMRMRTAQKLAKALGLSLETAERRGLIEIVRNVKRGATRAKASRQTRTRAAVRT